MSAMYIVILVAIGTFCRSLIPRFAALVAPVACQSGMRAIECEVGQAMVETPATQLHDVGLATLVLGVARAALAHACIRHAAMIAAALLQIGLDFRVTIQA